ncbi:HAD-IA family hydrolase [Candidatus Saccharibacteria bacterium]|nr:HAD-IA family hydrolase [Candidatus Saccharibacteria bacterium]MCA9328195.1 HAD-IA family hydrolase [Candidatus Saccharibacteria bacterium]
MSGGEASEKALGKAIQRARQAGGLTQQDLCQKASLSYSTLAKIERGAIKTPSVFTVARIASVLGVSLDEMLGGVAGGAAVSAKKKSRSGISFLYVDINGCMVHFFHGAFSRISQDTGVPADVVETAFWHFNDAVCRGDMSMVQFNQKLAKQIGVESIDWNSYYLDAIEAVEGMAGLLSWASQHYRVGLLSNIMPSQIRVMIDRGLLPNIHFDAIIDSSEVKAIKPEPAIYTIATERSGVPAHEILFVDDSRTNLMAAEQHGWRVMWFDDMRPADSVAKIRATLEF